MDNLEERIIDILIPFYGDNKSKNKLNKILSELNITFGTLDQANLSAVADKLEESCKNLGTNTAATLKERILKLS